MPDRTSIIRKVLHVLKSFSDEQMSLSGLIASLEIWGRELDDGTLEMSEFWRHWFVLEEVLAETLDRHPKDRSFTPLEGDLLQRSVAGLREWGVALLPPAESVE